MTGWAVMLALTLLTGGGLYLFVGRDRGALQFAGAALLLALAGYGWQGRPGLAGAPKSAPDRVRQLPDSEFAKARGDMLGRFDQASAWLNMADSFQRRGNTQMAAELLQGAVRRTPNNPDLWVGYGNALFLHGRGMSPAAQLAFERAARLAPGHPAPRFFYGLALAQSGDIAGAERIWRAIVAEAPPEAEYRRLIEERLNAIAQARAAGRIPR